MIATTGSLSNSEQVRQQGKSLNRHLTETNKILSSRTETHALRGFPAALDR